MDKLIISTDISSVNEPVVGQMVYNTDEYTIMIYDGNAAWRHLNCDVENIYNKRKRIINKLLSE